MVKRYSQQVETELNRIATSALAAREVFQHALGETFLRFERNVDSELAREIVDALRSRENAARWMAGISRLENTLIPYEIYLEQGRDAVLRSLGETKISTK